MVCARTACENSIRNITGNEQSERHAIARAELYKGKPHWRGLWQKNGVTVEVDFFNVQGLGPIETAERRVTWAEPR